MIMNMSDDDFLVAAGLREANESENDGDATQ